MAAFILVNNKTLAIVKGAKSVKQLECWAELEAPKDDFLILNTMERRQFSVYSIAELAMIYGMATGKSCPAGDYAHTLKLVVDLARDVPEDPATFEQLVKRMGGKPLEVRTRPAKRDLTPNPETDPVAKERAQALRDARAAANEAIIARGVSEDSRPGHRRTRSGGGASSPTPTRPKGGITGRVWAIADECAAKGAKGKDLRAAIIAACTGEGIDPSTAATQYSKWNRAKGAT